MSGSTAACILTLGNGLKNVERPPNPISVDARKRSYQQCLLMGEGFLIPLIYEDLTVLMALALLTATVVRLCTLLRMCRF